MQARIILNSLLVGTLLLSGAVFADAAAQDRADSQQEADVFAASNAEVLTIADSLQKRSDESRTEILERIMLDVRTELGRQFDATKLLVDAAKAAQGYLQISISDMTGKFSVTAL
ncbi:MAG: hypothetical protein V4628_15160 [Pseudomonadota bacterium]